MSLPRNGDAAGLPGVGRYVAAEAGHPFGFQPLPDVPHGVACFGIPAIDVAAVEGLAAGQARVGLAHDPPDQLRDRSPGGRVIEHRQHAGERAVPAFHQRRAGDDPAHRAEFGQEIDAGKFVPLGGFHRHCVVGNPQGAYQIIPHVLGVDALPVALVLARAFHPHHRDGPYVATFAGLQRSRLGVQIFQFVVRPRQRMGPFHLVETGHMDRKFYHLLGFQLEAADIDEEIADAGVGRGGKLDDQTRVEAADRTREFLPRFPFPSIGLVRLVEHHDGAQHLEDVEQAVLDGTVRRGALQVGMFIQQPRIAEQVITVRKQGRIAPGIAEHPQEILALPAVGRGQHQQHDAQIVRGVRRRERIVLFQQPDPAAAGALQHLAIGVLPVPQRRAGLFVDGASRGYPERQAGLPVQPFQRGGGEQGLAAAGRHLEADVGNRPSGIVGAAGIGRGGDSA